MGTVSLNHLTKVEGHASLTLKIEDGKVKKCDLRAVEGSRYFEGLLVGKKFNEASWVSSRICGICSCAHTVTAVKAIENALGMEVSKQTKMLRELYTIGERIRSHITHLYFLVLPDYMGFESALEMAPKHKKEVMLALKMMKVGNDIIQLSQGRDLHPISTTPGGFLKLPTKAEMDKVRERLIGIREAALKTYELFDGLPYPEYDFPTQYFSLTKEGEYALLEGDVKAGKIYKQENYHDYIKEYHDPDNTANFVVKDGKTYMVGALARMNNNREQLWKECKDAMKGGKVEFPSTNPFHINVAQAVEVIHFIEQAIYILDTLNITKEEVPKPDFHEGHGIAAVEVPRGTLWHEYKLDDTGRITYANIVTPTAQNLRNTQEDLNKYIPTLLNKNKEELVLDVEKLIRSYDPCFSCSAHFLKVKWL